MGTLHERKLQAVIRNAYEHVPYHRSLFRSAGLTQEDIRTLEDLEHGTAHPPGDLTGGEALYFLRYFFSAPKKSYQPPLEPGLSCGFPR